GASKTAVYVEEASSKRHSNPGLKSLVTARHALVVDAPLDPGMPTTIRVPMMIAAAAAQVRGRRRVRVPAPPAMPSSRMKPEATERAPGTDVDAAVALWPVAPFRSRVMNGPSSGR